MIKNNRSAFTLAEMMVVMLILTILLAAFAPLMTKKSKVDLSNPWRWANNNSDIYYGMGANQTAMIGKSSKAATDPNTALLINTTGNKYALSLTNGSRVASLMLNPNNDNASLCFGSASCGGNQNTSFGLQALNSNTGKYNTANGYNALFANTTGTYNTANGYKALYSNTTGDHNTAIGYNALFANTTGKYNTANGDYALSSNTTGHYNTAIGLFACDKITSGSHNICIGYHAGPTTNASYTIYIGTASHTVKVLGSLAVESDKRLKNIKSKFTSGLDTLRGLTTYYFTYKSDKTNQERVGIIAQDLQKVLPGAVMKNSAGFLEVKQEQITYAMLNAIKELDKMLQDLIAQVKTVVAQVNAHDAQIKALQKENKELKNKIQTLEKQNKSFEARLKAIEKKL